MTRCADCSIASADRRPVDPPPVVELRIFEGDAKNDITFSYNANFFLFTTLESARPIAQGRVPAVQAPFPVLTGMPVAGMAYLDRPTAAGYFIFPDLSVRHEGKYRLSFNLFEEVKEPKDADAEPPVASPEHPNHKLPQINPLAPQAHVHFRLEVKSEPFVVFSAKKFPGLAESTSLSRIVAEQGCRVRIRRDVRMRRRDTKPNKDYEEYDEEATYARADRFATPDMYSQQQMADRPRSVSNASVEAQTPYAGVEQRRPSVQDMGYYNQPTYQQAPPPASVPQPISNAYGSHLSFGGSSTQYQTPSLPSSVAAGVQPAQNYAQNATNYQYPPPAHTRQIPSQQAYGYPASQGYQHPHYQPVQTYGDGNDYRPIADYRRAGPPQNQPSYQSQAINGYSPVDNRQAPTQQNYYPPPVQAAAPRSITPCNPQLLPPLKTLQPPPERKYDQPAPVSVMSAPATGSSSNTGYEASQNIYNPYSATSQHPASSSARQSKRSFSRVFDTGHLNQSIHGGMRPDTSKQGQDVAQIELDDGTLEDEDELPNLKLLSYRRADGSRQHKKCPSPISE